MSKENIKVVILAGGRGTRFKEQTEFKPKPLIEIGNAPILLHIMKIYTHYGFNDFIIALGYKGDMIKNYFLNYLTLNNDIQVDLKENKVSLLTGNKEHFKVTLVDTGLDTQTGTRIKKLQKYIGNNTFMVTYGDGIGNIDIEELYKYHLDHKKIATITGVKTPSRWGEFDLQDKKVMGFKEKPEVSGSYINGGFFVFEPEFFNYLSENKNQMLEREPLENVSKNENLIIYKHDGFWKCIDTHKDYSELNRLYKEGAPWEVWKKSKNP